MAQRQYQTFSLNTLDGIKAAEKLHESGKWTVIMHTFSTIMFERKI